MRARSYCIGMAETKPILYVKEHCPWCAAARDYFAEVGLEVEEREVRNNAAFMEELQRVSGQTYTPTLKYGDFMVKDFSVEEFQAAVDAAPDVKKELGLG
ncbi:MAG: glutaredoxin family protein [Opitutales bacterium]